MILAEITGLVEAQGLMVRGVFQPEEGERLGGTVILLGFAGRSGWATFAASPEAADDRPDPLDRWSRRVVGDLARHLGAEALFPFGGPPWHPFQAWARRADEVWPSPIGLLIHPVFGLWHSYRGALALAGRLDLPARVEAASPCTTCVGQPCLSTCPVGAFRPHGYDVAACRAHVVSRAGEDCRTGGCLARRACPVGREHAYGAEQSAFLMRAFAGSARA